MYLSVSHKGCMTEKFGFIRKGQKLLNESVKNLVLVFVLLIISREYSNRRLIQSLIIVGITTAIAFITLLIFRFIAATVFTFTRVSSRMSSRATGARARALAWGTRSGTRRTRTWARRTRTITTTRGRTRSRTSSAGCTTTTSTSTTITIQYARGK